MTGEARQNMPALSKLVKITEEEHKVFLFHSVHAYALLGAWFLLKIT